MIVARRSFAIASAAWLLAMSVCASAQDAITPDGGRYYGPLVDGRMQGQGRIEWDGGAAYEGEFAGGQYAGKGRWRSSRGDEYVGDFKDGQFTGEGVLVRGDGTRYEGVFRNWHPQGPGRYIDARGTIYEGTFVNGEMSGPVRITRRDGTTTVTGTGAAADAADQARTQAEAQRNAAQSRQNVEAALYGQRQLLDRALAELKPRTPNRINLFLLAIGGDGSQEVFRREVEFVRNQFDADYGTRGHSIALVNSRTTVATMPMATHTSIRESLAAIAKKMDKERDILFVFLTTHGSKDHELVLDLPSLDLANITPALLSEWLQATGIRWKVIVVSACYAGGYLGPLQDERTMVIAAARHDRTSFGCADENDFTYFGRAFFKEALPASSSFAQAFAKAETLVAEWETRDRQGAAATGAAQGNDASLPQIANPAAIDAYLKLWRDGLQRPSR